MGSHWWVVTAWRAVLRRILRQDLGSVGKSVITGDTWITGVWTEGSTLPHLYCSVINITVLHSPRVAECTVVEEAQVQGANSIGCVWINPSAVQGLTALLARSTLGRTATWWRGLWKPLQWLTNLQPSCSPCPLPPASFKLPPQSSRQSDLSNTEIWSH